MTSQKQLARYMKDSMVNYPAVSIESADILRAAEDIVSLQQGLGTIRQLRHADRTTGVIQYGLESVHSAITAANAEGGLTPTAHGLLALSLESLCHALEVPTVGLGVNQGGFSDTVLKQMASLEALEELIVTVDDNHGALASDGLDHASAMYEILKQAIPDAAARLYAIVSSMEVVELPEEGPVCGEGISRYLTNGDAFPDSIEDYLDEYVELGHLIVTTFTDTTVRAAEATAALGGVSFADEERFMTDVEKVIDHVPDPRECLSASDYELCLPGSGPLFADDLDGHRSAHDERNPLEVFALSRAPVDPSDFEPDVELPEELPRLSRDEIRTIGESLYMLAMACDPAQYQDAGCKASFRLDKAIQSFTTDYDKADEQVADVLADDASLVIQYMNCVNTMVRWTPIFFLANLVQTLNAFILYAERSLGVVYACPKDPIVSQESISLEAGLKLRPGMRVKYSGGYGKIVKIFDRPTKYKGEIHHCTKDSPKYEVKSDVGNKLSLHKAGALTPT